MGKGNFQKLLVLEEEHNIEDPLIRKLDELCTETTRELRRLKPEQYALMHKLCDAKTEYQETRRKADFWNELSRRDTLSSNQGDISSQLSKDIKSLHIQLRHKSSKRTEEKAILRELMQLEIAREEAKEKEKTIQIEPNYFHQWTNDEREIYYKGYVNLTTEEEYAKRCRINRIEKDKNVMDNRIEFLEKKLARIYRRLEETSAQVK